MDIQQDNEKQNIRNRHIDIRLTEEEYKMVVEKAAECGSRSVRNCISLRYHNFKFDLYCLVSVPIGR